MSERRRIQVQGIVQGVGFRPFVYGLATRASLSGYVLNDANGVTIEVEGEPLQLKDFIAALETEAPPLAVIARITVESLPPSHGRLDQGFAITESHHSESRNTFISPDVATCDDCLRELFDPADRRYRYPFTNCTNCGPRFTIIRDVPYDRPLTTMTSFKMCPDCQREYDDPADRRFHAQPNACPACGPQVILDFGRPLADLAPTSGEADEIVYAQSLLSHGCVVAIKGLGGYHLACDATDQTTVRCLRASKQRWDKPFALMAANLAVVESICELNDAERALLTSRQRPIVLLRRGRNDTVAPDVAPGQKMLGVMLPYTPLHHLLFAEREKSGPVCKLLVMTSGNASDEPIVYHDEDAAVRLAPLADAFLRHNRDIHIRCDDSVTRVVKGVEVPVRRSRGYAPQPLSLDFGFKRPVLAVGAHLKNTFCLGKGRFAFLSQHIGDLENLETLISFQQGIEHFKCLFDVEPEVIAHDLHPDYLSTRYALEYDGLQRVAVQHHHAHVASVLAEHGLIGPVIGVAFDGTGYGPDGTVWGGEFLLADMASYERAAHLAQAPLPGGEQAIHQPWRVAAAWLQQLYGDEWLEWPLDFSRQIDRKAWRVLERMIARRLNCPLTSSMGRLFDAVAALLGVRQMVNYEGQAAMELEAALEETVEDSYTFSLRWPVLDPAPVFEEILTDVQDQTPLPVIAGRFHNAVAGLIVDVCQRLRQEHGLHRVALTGGVFQNAFLLGRAMDRLQALRFDVYTNRSVPPNDGGISLGQAAVANQTMS